jgi:predicted dehydrogenase
MRFASGSRVDVHLDFIQRSYSRYCTLAGTEGTLRWELLSNVLQVLRPGAEPETIKFDWQINDAYVAELRCFLECVRSGAASATSLEDAILTLRVTLAARESAEQKRWVSLA